ncbi:MAG TPA: hypothetical protein VNZ68_11255 [Rhodocyclaceae bacterium]|nr:hypothetical protein [Rhodocyclaceae bacterium]
MEMHLNRKTIGAAAIAAAAATALGALAFAYKKHRDARSGTRAATTDADLLSNIGPGEINPYVDAPTDPANQN